MLDAALADERVDTFVVPIGKAGIAALVESATEICASFSASAMLPAKRKRLGWVARRSGWSD